MSGSLPCKTGAEGRYEAHVRIGKAGHADREHPELVAGAGTASEVAYAVGFKSVWYFSDSFVRAYGCRPSSYGAEGAAGDETA